MHVQHPADRIAGTGSISRRRRAPVLPSALALLLLAGSSMPAAAADFTSPGGPIPDNDPSGLVIAFDVAGLTRRVRTVRVQLDVTHSFIGDLHVQLEAPQGIAKLPLFSRVGVKADSASGIFGSNRDLAGVYAFRDDAPAELWAASGPASPAVIAAGAYRTSTGGVVSTLRGGCTTTLELAFGGLTPAQANGTWTLQVADRSSADIGFVSSATLTIVEQDEQLFRAGFEENELPPAAIDGPSLVRGSCTAAPGDFNGSGRSEYMIVRPFAGAPIWAMRLNGGVGDGSIDAFFFGELGDYYLEADVDDDGFADAVVWQPSRSRFLVRRSSRPEDLPRAIDLPVSDPFNIAVLAGDFDHDGIVDLGVYHQQPDHRLLFRESLTGQLQSVPLPAGVTSNSFAFGGEDMTGDGKADVGLQVLGAQARIFIYQADSGALFDDYLLGTTSDFVTSGQFVGDGRADVVVSRAVGNDRHYDLRDSQSGAVTSVVFGIVGDVRVNGDFDGDGIRDLAVYRGTAPARFIVRRSSEPGAPPIEVPLGIEGDYPLLNWHWR
jgi:subtilisin-like proprotein convertase family protein